MGRLIAIEAQFYTPASRGKLPIEQVQELIRAYNGGTLSDAPPDEAIEVEALPPYKREN
jgi:hypothetical protein